MSGRRMLSCSCLIKDSSCSTVLGLLCCCFQSHAVVAVCSLALSCRHMHFKKKSSGWQQNALTVPFQMWKLRGINAPLHHQGCRYLNLALITSWMVLTLEDTVSMFSKRIDIGLTTEQFSTSVHFGQEITFNLHLNCVHRQWCLKVFQDPCNDFHDRIMSALNAVQ